MARDTRIVEPQVRCVIDERPEAHADLCRRIVTFEAARVRDGHGRLYRDDTIFSRGEAGIDIALQHHSSDCQRLRKAIPGERLFMACGTPDLRVGRRGPRLDRRLHLMTCIADSWRGCDLGDACSKNHDADDHGNGDPGASDESVHPGTGVMHVR